MLFLGHYENANVSYDKNFVRNECKEGIYQHFNRKIMLDCGLKTCVVDV